MLKLVSPFPRYLYENKCLLYSLYKMSQVCIYMASSFNKFENWVVQHVSSGMGLGGFKHASCYLESVLLLTNITTITIHPHNYYKSNLHKPISLNKPKGWSPYQRDAHGPSPLFESFFWVTGAVAWSMHSPLETC